MPPAFDGDVEHAMDSSRQLRLEGVLAKRRGSTYSAGRRSRAWIKIKHHLTQEVVIGGWRPGKGNRAAHDRLAAGRGAGGRRAALHRTRRHGVRGKATGRHGAPVRPAEPQDHAVPRGTPGGGRRRSLDHPESGGEVEFAEWTPTRRLRQPSWRGWRPDKSPDEVVEEN